MIHDTRAGGTRARLTARLASGALVGAVVLAGAGTAASASRAPERSAAHHHHRVEVRHEHREATGTVATLDTASGNFTIVRGATSIAVTVSSSTTYRERGVSAPSLAVGDRVVVLGTATAVGGGLTARRVDIIATTDRSVEGAVTAITPGATANTGTFTVARGVGEVTVTATATTVFTEMGVSGASFSSLKVGDIVLASGTVSNGALTAATVAIRAPELVSAVGTVAAVTTGGFTLSGEGRHTISVTVSSATTYLSETTAPAALASAAPGATVVVVGTRPTSAHGHDADATIDATTVVILS